MNIYTLCCMYSTFKMIFIKKQIFNIYNGLKPKLKSASV